MKPNNASVVEDALAMLLADLKTENLAELARIDTRYPMPIDDTKEGSLVVTEALELVSTTLNNCLGVHMARSRRRTNAFAPIHQLPPELLGQIFLFTIEKGEKTTMKILHPLAMVCFSWSRIVLNTPALWTTLDCSDPRAAHEWAPGVRRSGHLGLDVKINLGDLGKPNLRKRLATLNGFLLHGGSHRWQTLAVQDLQENEPITVWGDVYKAIPEETILESMTIKVSTYARPQERAWRLPNVHQLRHIETSGMMFIPSSPSPPSRPLDLHSLIISDVYLDQFLIKSLVELLESCPAMEELRWTGLWLTETVYHGEISDGEVTPINRPTTLLPNLRSFYMEEGAYDVAVALLPRLRSNSIRDVTILMAGGRWNEKLCDALSAMFNEPDSLIRQVLDGSRTSEDRTWPPLKVTYNSYAPIDIQCTIKRRRIFHLTISCRKADEFFVRHPFLTFDDAPPIHLTIADVSSFDEFTPEHLSFVPSLAEVHYKIELRNILPWVDYLAKPISGDTWPAPLLKEFVVGERPYGGRIESRLWNLLKARHKAWLRPEETGVVPLRVRYHVSEMELETGEWTLCKNYQQYMPHYDSD